MMRDIVFLTHQSTRLFGSAVARSEQMASLVSDALKEIGSNVIFTVDPKVTNSLIILNKGYLMYATPEELIRLRSEGNIIIADFVDLPLRPQQIEVVDGLMACCFAQETWFRKHVPGKPVFHVTQIVDPRFPAFDPPTDKLRPAYFGALMNAEHRGDLNGKVDFLDTPPSDIRWMSRMCQYNFHYAVRRRQKSDGFKPFGKGFVAARLKCPIIVSTVDDDALTYLGRDYPYLAEDDSLENVLSLLAQAESDFGGPRWQQALDKMREIRDRSCDDFIINEFKALAAHFINA